MKKPEEIAEMALGLGAFALSIAGWSPQRIAERATSLASKGAKLIEAFERAANAEPDDPPTK